MTPVEADNYQQWKGMDGATAYHLIDRHAEVWGDAGEMMNAWLRANQPDELATLKQAQEPVDSELASAEALIANISGSALLAGEKCHKDDSAILYKMACDALVTVGYVRSLLSAAPTIPDNRQCIGYVTGASRTITDTPIADHSQPVFIIPLSAAPKPGKPA